MEQTVKIREDWDRADVDYLLEELPRALDQSLDGANRVASIDDLKEFAHPASTKSRPWTQPHREHGHDLQGRMEARRRSTSTSIALAPIACLAGEINQWFSA